MFVRANFVAIYLRAMRHRSMRSGSELAREIKLTDWSMARNLSNRSSGVQIPRDICTRLKRYLYSAKCSWIIKGYLRVLEFPNFILLCIRRLLLIIAQVVLMISGQLQRLPPWHQVWLHWPFKQSKPVTMGWRCASCVQQACITHFLFGAC